MGIILILITFLYKFYKNSKILLKIVNDKKEKTIDKNFLYTLSTVWKKEDE